MSLQHPLGLSCTTCRSRKRRCDKRLPRCSLCTRKDLRCSYTQDASSRRRNPDLLQHQVVFQQRSSTSLPQSLRQSAPLNERGTTLELPNQTPQFPPVLFLDSKVSQKFHVEIPNANHTIPVYVGSIIGDITHWHSIAKSFFETVHLWMPIISKKRFYENTNPLCRLRSDYALLIMCMDLICWIPGSQVENPRTPKYLAAKRYFYDLEIAGVLSIQALQSGILIAIFEFGHGIYPSAFLSVGLCTSYASALGLDWRAVSISVDLASWSDIEEKNRILWAILLLTRVMNVGKPERQLVVLDPEITASLPGNDAEWDQGIMPRTPRYSIATPTKDWGDMGSFALVAQATRLLGQVLRHISESSLNEEEAILLDKTLHALVRVVLIEGQRQNLYMMNQDAICSIALCILHEAHASLPKLTKTSLYFASIHQAKMTTFHCSESMAAMPNQVDQKPLSSCVAEASPFLVVLIFQAAIFNQRIHRKEGMKESLEAVGMLNAVLERFDTRWKSAGAYLKVLEARDMLY